MYRAPISSVKSDVCITTDTIDFAYNGKLVEIFLRDQWSALQVVDSAYSS